MSNPWGQNFSMSGFGASGQEKKGEASSEKSKRFQRSFNWENKLVEYEDKMMIPGRVNPMEVRNTTVSREGLRKVKSSMDGRGR